jgi:uncharacterized membrane protein YphA (DoxX/SURF4 family)
VSWLKAIDRWWYAPAPPARVALLRVLVGGFALAYVLIRFTDFSSLARLHSTEFQAVGGVAWLTAPLPPALLLLSIGFTVVAGMAFVIGYRYRLSGPLFGLLLLALTSYRNSWGMLFHTENLLVLHVLVLAAAPAADAFSIDARQKSAPQLPATDAVPSAGKYGWPTRALSLITIACYVLAGVAKLKLAGQGWFHGDFLRSQVAFDNLRKIELGSIYSPLGAELVRHAWPFSALAWLTMIVELGAPLALLGRRWAALWVSAAWGFHAAILATMAIVFPYQLSLLAYLSLFPIERASTLRPGRWLLAKVRRLG